VSEPELVAFALGSVVGILASVKAKRPIVRFGIGFAAVYAAVIVGAGLLR
jgi:hypothetical protein